MCSFVGSSVAAPERDRALVACVHSPRLEEIPEFIAVAGMTHLAVALRKGAIGKTRFVRLGKAEHSVQAVGARHEERPGSCSEREKKPGLPDGRPGLRHFTSHSRIGVLYREEVTLSSGSNWQFSHA